MSDKSNTCCDIPVGNLPANEINILLEIATTLLRSVSKEHKQSILATINRCLKESIDQEPKNDLDV